MKKPKMFSASEFSGDVGLALRHDGLGVCGVLDY